MSGRRPPTWNAIQRYALRVNGYEAAGSAERCADIANELLARYEQEGAGIIETTSTDHLRWSLFFEQRRWRHYGWAPDERAMEYILNIVATLRRRGAAAR